MQTFDLYVIFHGSFAFHDDSTVNDKEIHAYATPLNGHVYMAGSWFEEECLPDDPGPFMLSGVHAESKEPSMHASDFAIRLTGAPTAAVAPLRKFVVPRPSKIYFRMIAENTTITCDGAAETLGWGLVPVFAYTRAGGPVTLTGAGFLWEETEGLEPTTLHIWATDDVLRERQGEDLQQSADLLGHTVLLTVESQLTGDGDVIPGLIGRDHETGVPLYLRNAAENTIVGSLTTCGPVVGGKK